MNSYREENNITPVILAGGANSRMGKNKALLEINGNKIIEIMVRKLENIFGKRVYIVTNQPEIYKFLHDVSFVKDIIFTKQRNSLVGLYSGLSQIPTERGLFLPCDMPFINEGFIRYLTDLSKNYDLVVPKISEHYQPLHGVYHKNCLKPMKRMIDREHYKIVDFFSDVNLKTVGQEIIHRFDPDEISFYNINNDKDYEQAKMLNNKLRRMNNGNSK